MFRKVTLILTVFLLMPPSIYGGRFSDACEWITISPSARSAGVGISYYGILKGAYASLFNPAAPGLIREREINAHHGIMLADITYDSIAYLEPGAGKGCASFIAQYYATDKMQEIREGEPGNKFRNSDIALNIGYSYPFKDGLACGLNLKVVQSKIADFTAQGIGSDFGICGLLSKNTILGLSFNNISTPLRYDKTDEYLPFFISCGISHTLKSRSEGIDLTFALGARYMDYEELEIGFGIEHTAYKQFSIRAGYQYNNMENKLSFPANFTAGVGMNMSGILVDYAWVPYGEMGYTHRIGLGYRFQAKPGKVKKIKIKASPTVFSPNAGNLNIEVAWADIDKVAKWNVEITDPYSIKVRTLEGEDKIDELSWDGKDKINQIVLDGNYTLQLMAETDSGKKCSSNKVDVIVDGTPPEFKVVYSTGRFSPNGDGNNDTLRISITASDNNMFDSYRFKVYNASGKKVKEFLGEKAVDEIIWDGKDDYYKEVVNNGDYFFVAQARDIAGNIAVTPKMKITVSPGIVVKRIKITEEERGLKINLTSKVLFDTGKVKLKTASHESLDEVVSVLRAYPKNKVSIEGHTDSVGKAAVNKRLSLERATAVMDYIVSKGIDHNRITVVGWGEEKPVASNRKRSGQAANRRVEIIILKEMMEE